MITDEKLLSYNPSISYEKDFYSEKEKFIKEISIDENTIKDNDKLGNFDNVVNEINISVIGLNDDIKDLIAGVLDPIIDFIEDNKDYLEDIEFEDKEDNDQEDSTPEYDDTPEDDVIFIPIVNIIDNDEDKKDSIKKTYKDNLIDLFDNFFIKFKSVLDNYWINTGALLIGKPSDYKKFIMSDIPQSFTVEREKQHMLDLAMRSQIHRKSKASFAAKICPVDETLVHLRSLKMVTDLMIRYLDSDIEDRTTEYGSSSKTMLDACIVNYNNKYNYTYKNTYKYLNSSVELIDEVLQLMIQEGKTKKYLKE